MLNVSHKNDLIFMRMNVQVTYIFLPILSQKDSFCYRGKSKLGIGLFIQNAQGAFDSSVKGLAHIYKKAIYYFPVSYFCFATSQNCILAELRLSTVIRKVKSTDFVKRATSPKMQLAEFRFHTNFEVHSFL